MAKKSAASALSTQVEKEIKGGTFKPLYVFHGEEPYFGDRLTNLLLEEALPPKARAFNQHLYYGPDVTVNDLMVICRQPPMGAERTLIVVREAQHLSPLAQLVTYAKGPIPSTVLVLNYHAPFKRNLKDVKPFLEAVGKIGVLLESSQLRDYEVGPWIKSLAQEKGITLSAGVPQILIENLGTDLTRIENALEALRLAIPEGESTVSDALAYDAIGVSREFNPFELVKAISVADTARAVRIALALASNPKTSALPPILATLYGYFAKLLRYQALIPRYTPEKIAGMIGVSPYFIREYRDAAALYPAPSIRRIFGWLRYFDMRSKGLYGDVPPPAEFLKEMIIRIIPR